MIVVIAVSIGFLLDPFFNACAIEVAAYPGR